MDKPREFKIITRGDRRVLKDLLPLRKPLSVFIEPTNICNFRCTPCVHGQERTRNDLKPFRHMEMALFEKIISELKVWKGDKLRLLRLAVLGEPFLHPRIIDMIRLAKQADVADRVDTFSNGSVLTEQMCKDIVGCGLDHIRFSIYSVLEQRHRDVTKSACEVDRIHRNISMLRHARDIQKQSKPFILVKMFDTYSPENDRFFEMYKDIADEVSLEKVHDATKYSGYDLIKAYYGDEIIENQIKSDYQRELHQHRACPRPFMAMVINSTGDVLMCTHDAPKATKVGDNNVSTLQQIWNGVEIFKFREMQLSGRKSENKLCRNCDWYRLFPDEDNVDGFPIARLKPETID